VRGSQRSASYGCALRATARSACLALAFVAGQAGAASLVEVRVGRHADFTRVVLETDSPVRYELVREGDGELRVRLFASAAPRRLGSKSPVLSEVVVETDPAGAVARLALKGRPVDVKEMVLQSPPRIVLDLVPRAGAARATAAATKPAAPPRAEPAPAVEPEVEPAPEPAAEPERAAEAEHAAEPEPEGEAAPAAEPSAEPAPEAAPSAEPAHEEPEDAAASEADAEAARDAAAQAELDRLAGVVPKHEAPPAHEEPAAKPEEQPSGELAATPPAEEPGDPGAGAEEVAEPEVAALPPQRGAAPAPGALAFLPTPLDDPLVLGVVVVLLGLIVALTLLRRRGARGADEDSLASPFATGEAFAFAGASAGTAAAAPRETPGSWAPPTPPDAAMGPLFASAAERAPEAEADEEIDEVAEASIYDVAEDEPGRAGELDYASPVSSYAPSTAIPPASVAAAGEAEALEGDVMRVIGELERRIAHLETRLEEVVDAKERLERHVAAQTEELRVQRAAIARTQRVLRTLVKPDDLATEPAPKA
jgi:hypothetical protein